MKNGWLTSACGQRIEKAPCPHPNLKVNLSVPAIGVLHTTEGSTVEAALSVFRQHYAPHFTVGPNRILQHVPLGYAASALEHIGNPPTNEWARVQIEMVGFSRELPWLPDPATLSTLVCLLATCEKVAGIPLQRVYPDALPPKPWATPSFRRRNDGDWGRRAGWYGHIEVPENAHWDPGALKWQEVLAAAQRKTTHRQPPPKPERPWHIVWRLIRGRWLPSTEPIKR